MLVETSRRGSLRIRKKKKKKEFGFEIFYHEHSVKFNKKKSPESLFRNSYCFRQSNGSKGFDFKFEFFQTRLFNFDQILISAALESLTKKKSFKNSYI